MCLNWLFYQAIFFEHAPFITEKTYVSNTIETTTENCAMTQPNIVSKTVWAHWGSPVSHTCTRLNSIFRIFLYFIRYQNASNGWLLFAIWKTSFIFNTVRWWHTGLNQIRTCVCRVLINTYVSLCLNFEFIVVNSPAVGWRFGLFIHFILMYNTNRTFLPNSIA